MPRPDFAQPGYGGTSPKEDTYQDKIAAQEAKRAREGTPAPPRPDYAQPDYGQPKTPSQPSSPSPSPSPAPAPTPEPEERYWWQPDWRDSAYNQQIGAINRALADYETDLGLQGQRYGTDYTQGVRELGYRPGEGFSPTVDVLDLPGSPMARSAGGTPTGEDALSAVQQAMMPVTGYDQDEAGPMARSATPQYSGGQWDYEGEFSPFSAAASGTRSTRDDFAGRGMIRSSDFAQTYADFQNRMQDQLQSMERGRTRFFEDAAVEAAQRRSSAEERRQSARVNAMARAAQAGEYRTR